MIGWTVEGRICRYDIPTSHRHRLPNRKLRFETLICPTSGSLKTSITGTIFNRHWPGMSSVRRGSLECVWGVRYANISYHFVDTSYAQNLTLTLCTRIYTTSSAQYTRPNTLIFDRDWVDIYHGQLPGFVGWWKVESADMIYHISSTQTAKIKNWDLKYHLFTSVQQPALSDRL